MKFAEKKKINGIETESFFMNYKEIYKPDMLKYINEEAYNVYGPRTHFYKFNRYIIALGKFKQTNETEVQIIRTHKVGKTGLDIPKICNYIIILIQDRYLKRSGRYKEDIYFRCDGFYELRETYHELLDILTKMNSLDLYDKMYVHVDEDGKLLVSSRDKLITRAEDRVIGKYFI